MNTLPGTILLWVLAAIAVIVLIALVVAIALFLPAWRSAGRHRKATEARMTEMREEFDARKARVDKHLRKPF